MVSSPYDNGIRKGLNVKPFGAFFYFTTHIDTGRKKWYDVSKGGFYMDFPISTRRRRHNNSGMMGGVSQDFIINYAGPDVLAELLTQPVDPDKVTEIIRWHYVGMKRSHIAKVVGLPKVVVNHVLATRWDAK